MSEFAELAADVAGVGFDHLGDTAVYRPVTGGEIRTRALVSDANVTEGHGNHASITARLPAADVCQVSRGDRLCVAERDYSVVTQIRRDRDVVEVALRDKD